jgi:hypothetical protein
MAKDPYLPIVRAENPDLDVASAGRIGLVYNTIAEESGTTVEALAAEARRAENSSAAGNELST